MATVETSKPYRYGGARALVELHARYLREFLAVWQEADRRGVELPATRDSVYASRAALLAHVFDCARGYLKWICEQLGLPAPEVGPRPTPEEMAGRAEAELESILAAWELPLRDLTEERAYEPAHPSRWGPPYCIDAMLEHAVMHPIRHAHQLRRLMDEQAAGD